MTKPGNDRLERTFARRVDVRVARLHRKQLAAILEHEPESGNDDAAAHSAIIALDEADHVALVIGGAEVDRVAVFQRRIAGSDLLRGAFRIDELSALGRVRFRKQAASGIFENAGSA